MSVLIYYRQFLPNQFNIRQLMFHVMDSGDTSVHILYEVKNGGSRLKIFSVFQMDSSPCIKTYYNLSGLPWWLRQ